jgi:N-acyl amino acid synthase of PEP-CTERM/exosortase system
METVSDAKPETVFETAPNAGDRFRQYFEIVPGVSEAVRDCVYQIRHEVYCEDLHYEPSSPDCRETDRYDAHSLLCLMRRSDHTHELVGCTRLVLAQQHGIDYDMPFERLCADSIDRSIIDPSKLPRHEIAEVSRLAVRRQYRQRKNEDKTTVSLTDEDFGVRARPRFPHIPIGLYLGSLALAKRHGIRKLFVLTEPRMAQHFCRLGVQITPIGEALEHRGTRLPSVMDVDSIIRGFRPLIQPVWEAINGQIDAHLQNRGRLPAHADRRARTSVSNLVRFGISAFKAS